MSNISQEYLLLFNAVTEAEELLRALREKLMKELEQEGCAEITVSFED